MKSFKVEEFSFIVPSGRNYLLYMLMGKTLCKTNILLLFLIYKLIFFSAWNSGTDQKLNFVSALNSWKNDRLNMMLFLML
jgi:hypothetical protein